MTGRVNRGQPPNIMYLDSQKVFDMVPQKKLVQLLRAQDIGENVLAQIQNELSHRKQRAGKLDPFIAEVT